MTHNKRAVVLASISKGQLVEALRALTVDYGDGWDHRVWSIADAETFEGAARLIRDGYGQPETRASAR
jgi:hypothetical protein